MRTHVLAGISPRHPSRTAKAERSLRPDEYLRDDGGIGRRTPGHDVGFRCIRYVWSALGRHGDIDQGLHKLFVTPPNGLSLTGDSRTRNSTKLRERRRGWRPVQRPRVGRQSRMLHSPLTGIRNPGPGPFSRTRGDARRYFMRHPDSEKFRKACRWVTIRVFESEAKRRDTTE